MNKFFRYLMWGCSALALSIPASVQVTPAAMKSAQPIAVESIASSELYYQKVSELVKAQSIYVGDVDGEAPYASGRLLVGADHLTNLDSYEGLCRVLHDDGGHYVLQFDSDSSAKMAEQRLSMDDRVDYVEPDMLVRVTDSIITDQASMDSLLTDTSTAASGSDHLSWGPAYMGTDVFSELVASTTDTSIVIGVVDTGASLSHPYLRSHLLQGYDFVDNDRTPEDGDGHGSHVSGIILDNMGDTNFSILPIRSLNDKGEGYVSDVANGVRYAVEHHASVINLSFGGDHGRYMEDAINYASEQGVICVVAAGNNGKCIPDDYCPAHIPGVITVGSIGKNGKRSSFSNYGPTLDFVAPGESIYSTSLNSTYAYSSGTSMAAPHVAACVALFRMMYPEDTQASMERELQKIASHWYKPDDEYGYGCIDMSQLIRTDSSCQHIMDYHPAQPATPTEPGHKSYYSCRLCGIEALDSVGNRLATPDNCTIPALQCICLEKDRFSYSGQPLEPTVTILTAEGTPLVASNYRVAYTDNVHAGTGKVEITLQNQYRGDAQLTFAIDPVPMKEVSFTKSGYTYNGSWPKLKLKYHSMTLKAKTDYSIQEQKLGESQTATVRIKGKGDYKGSRQLKFKLKLKRPEITELSRKKTEITVRWKKNTKCYDGYQVKYSYKKSLAEGTTVKVNGDSASKTLKKLKKGKTVYIALRGYKELNGGRLYSDWSETEHFKL